MDKTLMRLLFRLEGVRPLGSGFQARCSAHDDRGPSLSIKSSNDGKVLVHCHAGCRVEDVVAAVGLKNVEEVSLGLGLHRTQVQKLAKENRLPGAFRLGKRILISRAVFDDWLRNPSSV